jgi:hypothetical protein
MAAPVITPIDPTSGSVGVAKDTPIVFTVVDTVSGVEPTSIQAWIRGLIAYDGVTFSDGWKSSIIESITDGYQVQLVPDRFMYARGNEETGVRVRAEDVLTNATNERWYFAASNNIAMSTYRFILGSIRDLDEEQGS